MFKIEVDDEIHLELIHPSHAEDIFAIIEANRELFSRWLIWVHDTKTVEDTKAFINASLEKYARQQVIDMPIFYHERLVGIIGLMGLGKRRYEVPQAELGYWMDEAFHGKAIMRRALRKVLEIGFEKYGCEKIKIRCAGENLRSCNVAKKLGFVYEGTLRKDIVVNGRVMDANIYSLLRHEWEESR